MLRLNKLFSAPAVNRRFAPPGHANPRFLDRARLLDPAHPAAALPLRTLPAFVCPQFTIRAFPDALLHEPADFVPLNPLLATGLARARAHTHRRRAWWSNLDIAPAPHENPSFDAVRRLKRAAARRLADAYLAALAKRGRHNVSLLFHTSKKATSKSSVVRRRLRSKMTAAIDLVVGRNADAEPALTSFVQRNATVHPPLQLVSRPRQESLVLKDWTYLVMPDLTIYKTPLPNLVQLVRKALLCLSQQSKRLEASWSTLPNRTPRSPGLHSPHKAVKGPQSANRVCMQGSGTPRELAKDQSIATRLYSDRPVILPHNKP